jgi:hypothetical protein
MSLDARHSPFYAWLDNAAIRDLVHKALVLPPGERLVLVKGLVPGLVDDMGAAAVETFLDDLRTKTRRYAEAVAHPGEGGATRTTPGEALGGPIPEGDARIPERRDPRRPGGRALERQWEASFWEEVEGPRDEGGDDDPSPQR